VTYRPPSGAPVVAGTRASSGSCMRQARLLFIALAAALVAASPSFAAPGSVSSKQAEARSVMAQIQGLDANLERAVDSYNLANEKLAGIESDLRTNKAELKLAKANLKHAQKQLNAHLVAMYTSGNQDTGLEVLLGATSMDDLISRIDTMSRVSNQSADVLRQVKVFRAKVKQERARLRTARTAIGGRASNAATIAPIASSDPSAPAAAPGSTPS